MSRSTKKLLVLFAVTVVTAVSIIWINRALDAFSSLNDIYKAAIFFLAIPVVPPVVTVIDQVIRRR